MTTAAETRPGFFRRLFHRLKAMEDAMDYSAFDYTQDRIKNLEQEIAKLRDDVRSLRS